MNKPNPEGVVEIEGKKYLHLFRGTSLEWLKKDDGRYLDHIRHISFTTDRNIAEEFASINSSDGFTPIVIEALVPINEVDFEYSILPRFSKHFSYGNDIGQKEFSTIWQIPIQWMKGFWNFKNGRYNENKKFDPKFNPKKTPVSAFATYRDSYQKYMPQELEKLKKIYPDIENLWDKGFEKYFQLQEKVDKWGTRKAETNEAK